MYYLTTNFYPNYDYSILKYTHTNERIWRIATHEKSNINKLTIEIDYPVRLDNFIEDYYNGWRILNEISI